MTVFGGSTSPKRLRRLVFADGATAMGRAKTMPIAIRRDSDDEPKLSNGLRSFCCYGARVNSSVLPCSLVSVSESLVMTTLFFSLIFVPVGMVNSISTWSLSIHL